MLYEHTDTPFITVLSSPGDPWVDRVETQVDNCHLHPYQQVVHHNDLNRKWKILLREIPLITFSLMLRWADLYPTQVRIVYEDTSVSISTIYKKKQPWTKQWNLNICMKLLIIVFNLSGRESLWWRWLVCTLFWKCRSGVDFCYHICILIALL